MNKMVAKYKDMNQLELCQELEQLRREQLSLVMQASSGQLTKWHLIRNVRRNIARIKTFLNKA